MSKLPFRSPKYKGKTKDGANFVRSYGITKNKVKWSSLNTDRVIKGKNGKSYSARSSVFKTDSIRLFGSKPKRLVSGRFLQKKSKPIPYKHYKSMQKGKLDGYSFSVKK